MLDLEIIYAATFALLKTANAGLPANLKWITTSRWLKHWDDVPSNAQPALFLKPALIDAKEDAYGLGGFKIHAYAVIYFKADQTGAEASYPSQFISKYMKAVMNAVQALPVGEKQTLGGLVEHCRIEGTIHIDDGIAALDNQVVIGIPIIITVGGN